MAVIVILTKALARADGTLDPSSAVGQVGVTAFEAGPFEGRRQAVWVRSDPRLNRSLVVALCPSAFIV